MCWNGYVYISDASIRNVYVQIFQKNTSKKKFLLEMYREQRMVPKYSLFQISSQIQNTKLITETFHFPSEQSSGSSRLLWCLSSVF